MELSYIWLKQEPPEQGPHQSEVADNGYILRPLIVVVDPEKPELITLQRAGALIGPWLKREQPDTYRECWSWGNLAFKCRKDQASEIMQAYAEYWDMFDRNIVFAGYV